MEHTLDQIPVWRSVDAEMFSKEIRPAFRPAVLKGLVSDWPAVQKSRNGPQNLAAYLASFDGGASFPAFLGAPEIGGRFWYAPGMQSFNFQREQLTLSAVLEKLLHFAGQENPPSLYLGSVPTALAAPGFDQDNSIDSLGISAEARLWIGNAATVATHYDTSENVACVVSGRRQFTLFPPSQVANLYPGPIENNMAGPQVSMVRLDDPDYKQFPKFREALKHALTAELEPGDAIYIPTLWWHNVVSLDPLSVLANYWWTDQKPFSRAPIEWLILGLLTVRDLPEKEREAWRHLFDHFVFKRNGDPMEHLPPELQGVFGKLTPERAKTIWDYFRSLMSR